MKGYERVSEKGDCILRREGEIGQGIEMEGGGWRPEKTGWKEKDIVMRR